LVNVEVNRITPPGVVVATFAWLTISSWATVTVTVHRASVLPLAQLLPAVAEVTVLARMPPPVSGLSTVTE
jgi:hypothetical protein